MSLIGCIVFRVAMYALLNIPAYLGPLDRIVSSVPLGSSRLSLPRIKTEPAASKVTLILLGCSWICTFLHSSSFGNLEQQSSKKASQLVEIIRARKMYVFADRDLITLSDVVDAEDNNRHILS